MKFYLDTIFDRSDRGIEVIGPPQRFMIDANWKVASEQFACDGYHALTLHQSTRDLGLRGRPQTMDPKTLASLYAVEVAANGHSLRCVHASQYYDRVAAPLADSDPMAQLRALPPVGFTPEMVPQLPKHLGKGQLEVLARSTPSIGGMFPNIGLITIYRPRTGGGVTPMMCIHTFVPHGPRRFQFLNWFLAEKEAPPEMKAEMVRAGILFMGTTGMVESDDAETWPHVQKSAKGAIARQQTLKYQALAGVQRPDGWSGPGEVYGGFTKDDTQWHWWRHWHRAMTATS
jgi:hypothetical protein